jgi:cytochrome c-type biogenesis protein CcmH/NrfF
MLDLNVLQRAHLARVFSYLVVLYGAAFVGQAWRLEDARVLVWGLPLVVSALVLSVYFARGGRDE